MLTYALQVGRKEWLADLITRIDAKTKPLLSRIRKGEPVRNMTLEYQVDDFEEPGDIAAIDGRDVDNYSNPSPNRALLTVYMMKLMDAAMVSDLAENVSEVAGLPRGEIATGVMKKLERISRCMEAYMCGDQAQQAGGVNTAYKIRGLGEWIKATAQTDTHPVPAAYLTPSASIYTGTIANLTEAAVNDVLQSVYEQTGSADSSFYLLAGPTLKRAFSTFTRTQFASANTGSSIRTYNSAFAGKINNVVNYYEGDFGNFELIPTLFNAHPNFGGSVAANLRRGYLLKDELLSLHYKRYPRVRQLEDRGGGPRFLVDCIFGMKVNNPLGLGAFKSTS